MTSPVDCPTRFPTHFMYVSCLLLLASYNVLKIDWQLFLVYLLHVVNDLQVSKINPYMILSARWHLRSNLRLADSCFLLVVKVCFLAMWNRLDVIKSVFHIFTSGGHHFGR